MAELIIKKEDGTRFKLVARLYSYNWHISLSKSAPGKRKFEPIFSTDTYEYRKRTMKEREEFAKNEYLKYVTEEDIQEVINKECEGIKNMLRVYGR